MRKFKTEIKWGLLFAGMVLAWMLAERLAGLHDRHIDKHAVATSLILIPAIALYALALRDARTARFGGAMTYRQGLLSGLALTAVIAVLSPITQAVSSFLISPAYFENAIRFAVEKGMMDLAAAQRQFNFGSYLVQGVVGALVTGALMSAVVAAFTRRKALA